MSIGTQFNLLALGIPIVGLLILLGLIYVYAPSLIQAFLVLVGGFLALDGVVWNKLHSQLEKKTVTVWETHVSPVLGILEQPFQFGFAFTDLAQRQMVDEVGWLSKYGKYWIFRLYPRKFHSEGQVDLLIDRSRAFNKALDRLTAEAKSSGVELIHWVALDHWGLKGRGSELKRYSPEVLAVQTKCLSELDKTDPGSVKALKDSLLDILTVITDMSGRLEKFSSENGIVVSKSQKVGFNYLPVPQMKVA